MNASPVDPEHATRTHCPYCALQCGMAVRAPMSDGAPLRVSPDHAFPVNRGQMCIKGFTSADLLDHPERLRTPLLRRGGRLVSASWDEALDEIAARLEAVRGRHGPSALAAFGSGALTNEKAYWLGKFARLALRTPNIDYNGRFCMSSAAAGQNRAFGVDRGLPFPLADIAETDTLMLWGSNCADTMPPVMQWIAAQRDRGGALIVVDPRRTETARGSTLHLQLTPGTDLTLAQGLLAIAIDEDLVDTAYVDARTEGFEAARRAAVASDPAWVERITGVPIEQQRRAVRMLATVARSMILSGRGGEQQTKGTDTVHSLIHLMLALGKVGKPASGYGCLTGQGNGQGGREHGQKADQLAGYRLIEDASDRASIARVWGVDPADIPGKGKSAVELLDALGPEGGVRALVVFGSNLSVASPDSHRVDSKLRALELLVVCDAFENETCGAAHAVLPVTQWAEEEGTMTNLEGRVILRERVRPPPPGIKSDLEIMSELAARLGAGRFFPFSSPALVFDELRRATAGGKADYAGITYERIRREKGVFWPCPSADEPGTARLFQERFFHPNGLARFQELRDRPSAELPDALYPFYFTTGRYKEHYNSGAQTRRVKSLVAAQPEPRVEMHPRVASRLEVGDEDVVCVESRRGAVHFRVRVSPEIRPDTLFAPFHWGGQGAANRLTIPALDPTSRMPEFKVCAVRVFAVRSLAATKMAQDGSHPS